MLVDYERAWFRLKRVIGDKRSHGQRDLALAMANLEVECMLDDDAPPPEATVVSSTSSDTEGPLRRSDESGTGMPVSTDPLLVKEARNGNEEAEQRHTIGRAA